MRYGIALVIAGLVIAAGAAFCIHTQHLVVTHVRDQLPEMPEDGAAGGQPVPEDAAIPPNLGSEVPSSLMWRIQLADLLATFWYVWAFLVLTICLTAARFVSK